MQWQVLALGRQRQEDLEFKVIVSCIGGLGPAWFKWCLVSKRKQILDMINHWYSCLSICVSLLSIVIKILLPKYFRGWKSLTTHLGHSPSHKWSLDRNLKADTMEKHYMSESSCLTYFLIQPRMTSPDNVAAHSGMGPYNQFTIKTIPHKHAHRPIWSGQSLNWYSLLKWHYAASSR